MGRGKEPCSGDGAARAKVLEGRALAFPCLLLTQGSCKACAVAGLMCKAQRAQQCAQPVFPPGRAWGAGGVSEVREVVQCCIPAEVILQCQGNSAGYMGASTEPAVS